MPRISAATREERRQHLVDAGWRCVSKVGWSVLTVEDVCRTAGVAKGAFYGYFESKAELLVALAEVDAAQCEERLRTIVARAGSRGLRACVQEMVAIASEPGRSQLRADVWAAVPGDAGLAVRLRTAVARRRALIRELVETAIAAGELDEVPANALAAVLLALEDGLVLHHSLDPDGFRWENVSVALDHLIGGVARP